MFALSFLLQFHKPRRRSIIIEISELPAAPVYLLCQLMCQASEIVWRVKNLVDKLTKKFLEALSDLEKYRYRYASIKKYPRRKSWPKLRF